MLFPTMSEIQATTQKYSLNLVNAESCDGADIVLSASMGTVDSFCKIACDNHVNTLFIDIAMLEDDWLNDYLIDEDDITSDNYGSSVDAVLEKVQAHNKKIKDLASKGPATIELFFVLSGKLCSLTYKAEWYTELVSADDILEELTLQYKNEIESAEAERESVEKEKLNNLVDMLVGDETFQKCTTAVERRYYAFDLWDKENSGACSILAIEPYVKKAWEIVKARALSKQQSRLREMAKLLGEDVGFKILNNQQARKIYAVDFFKKQTDMVFAKTELEQIIESAKNGLWE